MKDKLFSLPKRLDEIAKNIHVRDSVADIGADHGLLSVFLAKKNPKRRIIASDISREALEGAKNLAALHNVDDKISFVVTDGLRGIDLRNIDTIVVSGLGGETITKILNDSELTASSGKKLILQPQTKQHVLYRWLYNSGYKGIKTKRVFDRSKRYTVIVIE